MKLTTLLPIVMLASIPVFGDPPEIVVPPAPQIQQVEETKQNADALQAGIDLFEAKKYEEAEKAFSSLRKAKVKKSTWGMASNNLGITLRVQKKYKEAVVVFESVLISDVDDRDPGGNLMETFRNYRYNACNEIARCYVETKDYKKALEYLTLAKTKYKFEADCATCAGEAAENLERHEKWLKAKLAQPPVKPAAQSNPEPVSK